MFANAGPSSEPIVMPLICRCMLLLKLNATEEMASCINLTKMLCGKDGYGFRKWNIGEETGNVKITKKDRRKRKRKFSDFFYKGERIRHTFRRKVLENRLKKRSKPCS